MRSIAVAGRGPSSTVPKIKTPGGQRRHGKPPIVMGRRRWHSSSVVLEHVAQRFRQGKLDGVESLQTALGAMPHLECHSSAAIASASVCRMPLPRRKLTAIVVESVRSS